MRDYEVMVSTFLYIAYYIILVYFIIKKYHIAKSRPNSLLKKIIHTYPLTITILIFRLFMALSEKVPNSII